MFCVIVENLRQLSSTDCSLEKGENVQITNNTSDLIKKWEISPVETSWPYYHNFVNGTKARPEETRRLTSCDDVMSVMIHYLYSFRYQAEPES